MHETTPDPAVFGFVLDAVHDLVVRVLGDDENDIDAASIQTALQISRRVQMIPHRPAGSAEIGRLDSIERTQATIA